jgi:hypothetical protein
MDAALFEIERLQRRIEALEAELASLKTAFGDTYQRNSSAPSSINTVVPSEWKAWPGANRT